ncbi:hypothetical protein [Butyricicoccus sp.]|uniref:hypothetical protein n=1 Tax=Butyricicoccus sp. TaxID=2049021 RepID=UPI003F13F4AD
MKRNHYNIKDRISVKKGYHSMQNKMSGRGTAGFRGDEAVRIIRYRAGVYLRLISCAIRRTGKTVFKRFLLQGVRRAERKLPELLRKQSRPPLHFTAKCGIIYLRKELMEYSA